MKVTRAALDLALALGLLWAPLAEAQQAVKTYRVGFLGGGAAPSPTLPRLLEALRPLGYVEGQNLVIERRYADGKADRLPVLAAELVQLRVDLIMTTGTPAARAAKQATPSIPIVFQLSGDPVESGLVDQPQGRKGPGADHPAVAAAAGGQRDRVTSFQVSGIAVHTGARVAALARPGEVLVSSTVKELVAGSGLRFQDRGVHTLKGVPSEWHLFAVAG
jgi:putative ABC transport system substrate-binding protein